MTEDLLKAIASVKMLSELPKAELLELLPLLTLVKAKSGELIIKESAEDDDIYFIADGQVKICHLESDGKEVIMALAKTGEVIGEIASIVEKPRSTDVIASGPCLLIKISAESLLRHSEKWPGLSRQLLVSVSRKLFAASLRIKELALHDVTTRTLEILNSISEENEYEEKTYLIVNPRPTHQDLASMVGTSREVISRTLKILEEAGDIKIDDGRLILLKKNQSS